MTSGFDKVIEGIKVGVALILGLVIFGQLCPVALKITTDPQAKESIGQVCTTIFFWMPKLIQ